MALPVAEIATLDRSLPVLALRRRRNYLNVRSNIGLRGLHGHILRSWASLTPATDFAPTLTHGNRVRRAACEQVARRRYPRILSEAGRRPMNSHRPRERTLRGFRARNVAPAGMQGRRAKRFDACPRLRAVKGVVSDARQ